MNNISKLLSHRLRRFSDFENSLTGFKNAIKSDVQYIEIDTRVSKDGKIYVYHDSKLGKEIAKKLYFFSVESKVLNALTYENGEPLLTLEYALDLFKNRPDKNQILCIDIKDFGYEEKHLSVVNKRGLIHNIVFVSWIPQTLIKLYELGATCPLIFSHINLIKLKFLGNIISNIIKNTKIKISRSILSGKNKISDPLGNYKMGYQHNFLITDIPDFLTKILKEKNGGICIHKSMFGKGIIEMCRKNGLGLWVFSVNDIKEFLYYSKNPDVDVVFCDNAPFILSEYKRIGDNVLEC